MSGALEPPQLDTFKAATRELEMDYGPKRFMGLLRKLVKHKPVEMGE